LERQLKLKLDDAVASALRWRNKTDKRVTELEKSVSSDTKLVSLDTKNVSSDTKKDRRKGRKAAERGVPEMLEYVKETLSRSGSWGEIQAALVNEAIGTLIDKELAAIRRAEIDAAQLTLPGFEHLPKRIGNKPVKDATVRQFFQYLDRYTKRANQYDEELKELREVAAKLDRFRIVRENLTLAEALAIVDAPRGLVLVKE
jgi:hypothetical protein